VSADHDKNRADLQKDPARVSGMFDQVAKNYDRTNTVLSMGNDRMWRVATTRAVAPRRGQRILDLAAGTGASSVSLAKSGADVVAADFSPGMIAEGRRRYGAGVAGRGIPNLTFVEADATALPFGDGEFDTVTMSFGLRNVNDPKKALRELLRVAKPGGRLVVCEFSHPPSRSFNGLYRFYNDRVLPVVAKTVSSNADALRLPERVDPRLARSAQALGVDPRGGVGRCRVPQPLARHRRAAPRDQATSGQPGEVTRGAAAGATRPDPGRLDG
jgi:demethylmenaquinone methyltransferase / 2-methoxy-6-polyprenyl-1,4-benzoquinol methylase